MSGLVEFSADFLRDLVEQAEQSTRRRLHRNIHATYADPVQRLFNAIGIESYIRPHRHCADSKRECLIGIRGRMALIAFDGEGAIEGVHPFGVAPLDAAGVELSPEQWHTVVALEPGSILFEVKQGPFDASAAKEFAPWSPEEGSADALPYLAALRAAALADR